MPPPGRGRGRKSPAVVARRRADLLEDDLELVEVVVPGEEGLLDEALDEDAGDGPDVDRSAVLVEAEHDLRATVGPARARGGPSEVPSLKSRDARPAPPRGGRLGRL